MRAIVLLFCTLMLAACSHELTFIGRKSGAMGTANITTYGVPNGKMDIHLNGKVYTGVWSMVREGATAFGSATAVSSTGHAVSAVGTTQLVANVGDGIIIARAPDGSTIRCVFRHSGLSGMGECVDNSDEVYDVVIRG